MVYSSYEQKICLVAENRAEIFELTVSELTLSGDGTWKKLDFLPYMT